MTVLRRTNPCFIADAWENSSGALLSQALVQYLLLVAVVCKAVLQLRGKKEIQKPSLLCLHTDDPDNEQARREKVFREKIRAAEQVNCKGFQGKAEVNFRHMQQLRKYEQDISLFANPQSLTVGCSL